MKSKWSINFSLFSFVSWCQFDLTIIRMDLSSCGFYASWKRIHRNQQWTMFQCWFLTLVLSYFSLSSHSDCIWITNIFTRITLITRKRLVRIHMMVLQGKQILLYRIIANTWLTLKRFGSDNWVQRMWTERVFVILLRDLLILWAKWMGLDI